MTMWRRLQRSVRSVRNLGHMLSRAHCCHRRCWRMTKWWWFTSLLVWTAIPMVCHDFTHRFIIAPVTLCWREWRMSCGCRRSWYASVLVLMIWRDGHANVSTRARSISYSWRVRRRAVLALWPIHYPSTAALLRHLHFYLSLHVPQE